MEPARREAPSAPPLGELLSEREAEGVRLVIQNVFPFAHTRPFTQQSGWVNRAASNIVPFIARHPLSQPVRADSSLREGAKAASPLAGG